MLTQAGCLRVHTLHQLFDVAQFVLDQPLPEGDRVAVVANSVALAALVADACVAASLDVVHGPISVPELAGPEEFRTALQAAFAAKAVDAVVAVFAPAVLARTKDIARVLSETAADAEQPVAGCLIGWDGHESGPAAGRRAPGADLRHPGGGGGRSGRGDPLRGSGGAGRTGWPWIRPGATRRRAEAMVEAIVDEHPEGIELDPRRTAELLAHYGIHVWPALAVSNAADAQEAADRLGWPVALKTTAPYLRHRVDLGGSAAGHRRRHRSWPATWWR